MSAAITLATLVDGVPRPPVDMVTKSGPEAIFTIVCLGPLLFSIGAALRLRRRDGSWLALFCIVGGATAVIVEPLLDVNGGVWWPKGGWDTFTLAGKTLPLLVPFVYPWLLGGQGYLAWRAFHRRANQRSLWRLFGFFVLTDVVLETIGLLLDTYAYHGNQAFNLWGLPLWYAPLNAGGPLVAGAIFYVLEPHFRGVRQLILLLVFPMSFALVYGGAGFPMWLSLQSDWPKSLADIAALATFALTYLLVTFTLLATATPTSRATSDPADANETSAPTTDHLAPQPGGGHVIV